MLKVVELPRTVDGGRNSTLYKTMIKVTLLLLAFALIVPLLYRWSSFATQSRWNDHAISTLERVKALPPEGIEKPQWDEIVSWTQRAIPNCFFSPDLVTDQNRFAKFRQEFDRKFNGEVSLETLSWVWDKFGEVTKDGERYSNRYRPSELQHK